MISLNVLCNEQTYRYSDYQYKNGKDIFVLLSIIMHLHLHLH